MPPKTVEERLTELENKVAQLLGDKVEAQENMELAGLPIWLQQWVGAFEDDPDFDAAMERGAEYRRLQPIAADEWDAIEAEKTGTKINHASA